MVVICLATSSHSQKLQHPAVISVPFATFPTGFSEEKAMGVGREGSGQSPTFCSLHHSLLLLLVSLHLCQSVPSFPLCPCSRVNLCPPLPLAFLHSQCTTAHYQFTHILCLVSPPTCSISVLLLWVSHHFLLNDPHVLGIAWIPIAK